jgi:hypothetical protein
LVLLGREEENDWLKKVLSHCTAILHGKLLKGSKTIKAEKSWAANLKSKMPPKNVVTQSSNLGG